MVKKFNLSVSDELAEKIEERRDYLGNLSFLFQEAVRDKIRKREEYERRITGGGESMEATIERLRAEKTEAENDWYDMGVKEGIAWAKNVSYATLQYMLAFDVEDHSWSSLVKDEILGEDFDETFKENSGFLTFDENFGNPSSITLQWLRGWKEGVETFWREVEGKL